MMDRRYFIGSGAVAAVAAAGGVLMMQTTSPALAQTDPAPAADSAADTSAIKEMVLGSEDAPVTLIEYASYTCPHCASFHANVYPDLKANYIDTGKVKFVFREVYFDAFGVWASLLARCNEPRFFPITDLIFKRQREWLEGENPAAIADNLRRVGASAGLDPEAIEGCLADEEHARRLVAWFQENAEQDDVTSTPTLMIDGEKHSNMSYADLSKILDEKLGG